MSNLIITIIAIALGAAVVLASMYSGGSAMTQGAAKSAATAVLNQAQQISGAATMFANDHGGTAITATTDLVNGNYLKALPKVPTSLNKYAPVQDWTLDTTNKLITAAADSAEICLQIEKQRDAGSVGVPTTNAAGGAFGCYGAASGTSAGYTVYYAL